MISRWKRLAYSAASVVITAAACDLAISVRSELTEAFHHNAQFAMHSSTGIALFVSTLVGVFGWVLLFCIPGWILALPIVLFAKNLAGLRFWIWWGAGTCIGPMVMYGVSFDFVVRYAPGTSSPGWNPWFSLATGVASLATLVYLLLLRREQRRVSG